MNDRPRWNASCQRSSHRLPGIGLASQPKRICGKHQQAAGEDDRHHARLIDPQRQVLPRAAVDAATRTCLALCVGIRRWPSVMKTTPTTTATNRQASTISVSTPICPLPKPVSRRSRVLPAGHSAAPGIWARMPAMISRLMPLPMPYSSICSPSHIRKIVPQVMVSTAHDLPTEVQRCRSPS